MSCTVILKHITNQGCFHFILVGPEIVVSPLPLIPVNASKTFTINCTAMGIPTPEIVWRLNWGCVPPKCKTTSNEQVTKNHNK